MAVIPADEIKRKAFHALTLAYIFAYWFMPRGIVLSILGMLMVGVVIVENIRLRNPGFNQWLLAVLGGVHRLEESDRMSGLIWTLSGSFLTILIFPNKEIVLASLFYLTFGDSFAALFGRVVGKHRIAKGKTLEGSIACFLVCMVIGFFFLDFRLALVGALCATFIELLPWPLNDNFWMPLISAILLTLAR